MSDREALLSAATGLRAGVTFPRRIIVLLLATFAVASVTLAVTAPVLLRIPKDVGDALLSRAALLATSGLIVVGVLGSIEIGRHRWVLRSLAIGSAAIEPSDLARVAAVPRRVGVGYLAIAGLFASLVVISPIRPERLDVGRATSLLLLGWTIVAASCVPLVMLARRAVSELLEIAPPDTVRALVERVPAAGRAKLVGQTPLLGSLVLPVALAGLGGALATHAHLRSLVEESRTATVLAIAHTALEPLPGEIDASGRREAARVATTRGYVATLALAEGDAGDSISRAEDGRVVVDAQVQGGHARFVFATPIPARAAVVGLSVAAAGVLLCGILAVWLARALSSDLAAATARIAAVGTERARVRKDDSPPARFEVVVDLENAAHGLADRFRVFAAAQERALLAKEAARRTRGLLFASVSHDLKSPLNAILGFAHLISLLDLGDEQRSSIDIVESRGRELLALIETILDASRIEAGHLELKKIATPVHELVGESIRTARELSVSSRTVVTEIDAGLPDLPVDMTHASRALGALLAHALRAANDEDAVTVRASLHADGERVRIDVQHAGAAPPSARERLAMLSLRAGPRGRGMALALSLARRVIELHGGSVEVDDEGPDATPVVRSIWAISPAAKPVVVHTLPPLSARSSPG